MQPLRIPIRRRAALTALGGVVMADAGAQPAWPSRPVRLVVPSTPGGAMSGAAAILAAALGRRWHQRLNLQFLPGYGTVTATLAVARSPADGLHLGLATSALAINAALRGSLPYDTLADLAPVSLLADFQYAVYAHRSLPVRNAGELVSHARHSRLPIRYASPGIGTGAHVAMESFAYEAGIRVAHVPFLSAVFAEKAVLGGDVPFLAYGVPTSIAAAMAGPLRLVALMGRKTVVDIQGVPWASNAVRGFELTGNIGVIAPRAVPAPLLRRLGEDLAASMREPDVRSAMADLGLQATGLAAADSESHLRADIARWRLVGQVTGIRLD